MGTSTGRPGTRAAVEAHLAAGANHVCVQSLPGADDPVPLFTALAGELGL